MNQRTQEVTHTYKVRLKNKELLKTLVDIETGHRGFLLTSDDFFLTPYHDGRRTLKTTLNELKTLQQESPLQSYRLQQLEKNITRRLSFIEENMERVRQHKSIDKTQLYLGKIYMDRIRGLSKELDNEEVVLLSNRMSTQDKADVKMSFYLICLSIVSLLFLLIFFRLLYVEFLQRINFQAKLEVKIAELERTNSELEQFSYITSHDLQEPLRKIRAFSERLYTRQQAELSTDAKMNIQKINQSAIRMQELINDLLAFSRVTNSKDYSFEKLDLNELLEESKEDFSELIKQKKAIILQDKLPIAKVIKTQILQLFNNLLSNSLKYSRADTDPVITIRYQTVEGFNYETLDNELTYHHITFMDNGIGFDDKYVDKIFTIFQRLHNKNEYEGTGIGLALCKKVVSNHHGELTAETRKDTRGAIFHIYLPC